MYIVIYGDPIEGFHHSGPYPDEETANAYADDCRMLRSFNWWTSELEAPDPARLQAAIDETKQ